VNGYYTLKFCFARCKSVIVTDDGYHLSKTVESK